MSTSAAGTSTTRGSTPTRRESTRPPAGRPRAAGPTLTHTPSRSRRSVGEALKLAGVKREELYITTKYDAIDGNDVRTEFTKSLKDVRRSSVLEPVSSSDRCADPLGLDAARGQLRW